MGEGRKVYVGHGDEGVLYNIYRTCDPAEGVFWARHGSRGKFRGAPKGTGLWLPSNTAKGVP